MQKLLGLEVVRGEDGSALIWFVFLVALLCLVVITLAASVHQYLFARELTDFTEHFAVAVKTKLQLQVSDSVLSLATDLFKEVSSKYTFQKLELKAISLEAGATVRVVFCAEWVSPVDTVRATRTICEMALAR